MRRVDLNVDIAEGFPWDAALLEVATSATVCCGAHAGSTELALSTIALCREGGVRVGLHPGYPDREGLGRRPRAALGLDDTGLVECLRRQVEPLAAEAAYIKPHGALYNESAADAGLAALVCHVLQPFGLPLLGLAGTEHAAAARREGLAFVSEGFADRAYKPDGHLAPRSVPGAVHTEAQAMGRQAVELAGRVGSICVHGDTPGCVEAARAVRAALEAAGYEVVAP